MKIEAQYGDEWRDVTNSVEHCEMLSHKIAVTLAIAASISELEIPGRLRLLVFDQPQECALKELEVESLGSIGLLSVRLVGVTVKKDA